MKPFTSLFAAGIFALGATVAVRAADVTHSILGLQVTNYTGYVIDADATTFDLSYHREHIRAQSRVQTANASGSLVLVEYYLRWRLLDSAGQPHPLYDSTGVLSLNNTYNL